MTSRIDTHIGADKTVVPDCHRGLVQYREIEVCKESFANADLLSVVAVERLVDADVVISYMPQKVLKNGTQLLLIGRRHGVVSVNHVLGGVQFPQQLQIHSRIGKSGLHQFFFCHNTQI